MTPLEQIPNPKLQECHIHHYEWQNTVQNNNCYVFKEKIDKTFHQ